MQNNFYKSEDWAKLKNIYGTMNADQKMKFEDLFRKYHTISKEVFALEVATFLNVVEIRQFLDIWIKIADFFEIDYKDQPENLKEEFKMETAFGAIKLTNKATDEFMELSFSTLKLTKKLLGNDIIFPQQLAPKIFKEMAEDHDANMQEDNEFELNALIGGAKIKVLENTCIVFLSTQTILRDFLARIYLNLRLDGQ